MLHIYMVAGERPPARALAPPAETMLWLPALTWQLSSKGHDTFLRLLRVLGTWAHAYMQEFTHTHKIKINLKFVIYST